MEMTVEMLATPVRAMVRSEIGAFPPDWPIRRLDQISGGVSVGLVINPSTYFSEYGTIPMLLGSQVTANKIDHDAAKQITPQSNAKIPASILRAGDLVTVRVGDPGTTAVIVEELDGCNCASMMIIRRDAEFNSAWLSHLLNSPIGRNQFANVQYGTAQKQFNIGDAVRFLFPVPSKAEQNAIASALSDTDTLIDSLEQLLTKKRLIKQGAMQELLTGKRRLPGFSGEWKATCLSEVSVFLKGQGLSKAALSADGLIPCIHYGQLFTEYGPVIDAVRSFVNELDSGPRSLSNDVLMPTSDVTPTGLAKASCLLQEGVALGGDILVIRSHPDLLYGPFLSNVIRSMPQKVLELVTGSTVFHLYARDMAGYRLDLPDVKEQQAIVQILSDMDTDIAALETRLTKARALKQAMAQALLTGRIRLVEPTA